MGESITTKEAEGMVIAVCLKQVGFVYARSGMAPERQFIDARDRLCFNNPADEEALEFAVRMKEKCNDVHVWVLSLGRELVPREAERALAMGADRFVQLNDPAWDSLDSRGIAEVLAAVVKKIGAELIICGAASLDMGRGEVGPFIAHGLMFPFVPAAEEMDFTAETGQMRLKHALGRGDSLVVKATLPLVVTVEQGTIPLRYPSHVNMLKAKAQGISRWDARTLVVTLDAGKNAFSPDEAMAPVARVKKIPLIDGDMRAFDRVGCLFAGRSRNKSGAIIEGDGGRLATSLVEFLETRGLLKRGRQTN